ncbi:hypothetical protein ACJX0J_035317, partial [Zea mays]
CFLREAISKNVVCMGPQGWVPISDPTKGALSPVCPIPVENLWRSMGRILTWMLGVEVFWPNAGKIVLIAHQMNDSKSKT